MAKSNGVSSNAPTLYLTELDVTRLEGIASRAGTAELDEMLDALLTRAAIVPPDAIPKDVVTMNSRVVCALEGEPVPRDWTLVYPDDADLAAGRLSVLSRWGRRCSAPAPARPWTIACRTAASNA